jgi:predicted transcriptional regulator
METHRVDTISLKPERRAQLEHYAQRHKQDAAAALDDVLADYFASEEQDYQASVQAIRRGDEDVMAGHTKPAAEVHQSLRRKYGFPG